MAEEQNADPELAELLANPESSLKLQHLETGLKTKSYIATFEHIHLDIGGPLPPSEGYSYLITIIDRFSRWPEAIPVRTSLQKLLPAHWFPIGLPVMGWSRDSTVVKSSLVVSRQTPRWTTTLALVLLGLPHDHQRGSRATCSEML
ncbi:hypothetical protein JTE90_008315 [Oedothorax gibbosus]|uniref:Integrase catalytic domain-containing protein n=1 Tax=Oedothorax gibbosus TaxID=931172 RepID=A0AAV6TTG9_9ARAC|nr:hypothetical protein JTE90_008315 [Oedothorax gibbosus]